MPEVCWRCAWPPAPCSWRSAWRFARRALTSFRHSSGDGVTSECDGVLVGMPCTAERRGTRVVAPSSHGYRSERSVSKVRMASIFCIVRPMSSRPLSRLFLRKASTSKGYLVPHSRMTCWLCRSISTSFISSASLSSSSTCSRGSVTGSMPFFMQLEWKMSAKDELMMQRMPMPLIDHGACSRLEPQPKLSPATRMLVPTASRPCLSRYSGRLRTKSATSMATPSGPPACATSTGFW
mmetsp:Transcript_55952/g.134096  ORF Transcript_55952/g.134096 Transcript_55952/m.134096 type:complete len:237 (+) Transcript_55952:129-839(+)